jgi:hypothetical protein
MMATSLKLEVLQCRLLSRAGQFALFECLSQAISAMQYCSSPKVSKYVSSYFKACISSPVPNIIHANLLSL